MQQAGRAATVSARPPSWDTMQVPFPAGLCPMPRMLNLVCAHAWYQPPKSRTVLGKVGQMITLLLCGYKTLDY